MAVWLIGNADGDFWSNEYGWVEAIEDATEFSESERCTLNLPIDGFWLQSN